MKQLGFIYAGLTCAWERRNARPTERFWKSFGFQKVPISGWWYSYPSEEYDFVNWDDYSQYMEKCINMFQTTNQLFWWILGVRFSSWRIPTEESYDDSGVKRVQHSGISCSSHQNSCACSSLWQFHQFLPMRRCGIHGVTICHDGMNQTWHSYSYSIYSHVPWNMPNTAHIPLHLCTHTSIYTICLDLCIESYIQDQAANYEFV